LLRFSFSPAGPVYRALGYFYVSGEGKGRDINTLSAGQGGPSFERWLKASSLGWVVRPGIGILACGCLKAAGFILF